MAVNDEPLAGFDPQTKAYVYRTPHAMSSVTLQAATTAARASLSGITVKRGDTVTDVAYTVSDAVYRTSGVPLPEGDSLFAIGVTAADGSSAESCGVTVHRAALPALRSSALLKATRTAPSASAGK
ncbi:cadherin-like beta sandwich domain-containing protein [Paenibacillus doosanensis]|nr:cadherin-like beta sandwich domain-containing protein [Paenibacillus doosanensis]MCS7460908.1 cadherin-like beta sandwich domain-containing protein [Paenibacillus doosanensis]